MAMKFSAIFFDFDDTLFDYEKSERYALSLALKSIGINGSEDLYLKFKNINRCLWDEYKGRNIDSSLFYLERAARYLSLLGCTKDEVTNFVEHYADFATKPFLIAGAEQVVQTLSAQTTLYIITNGFGEQRLAKLKQSSIANCFKHFYSSNNLLYRKPDAKVLKQVFDEQNLPLHDNYLFVGDKEEDVLTGKNFGVSTCLVNFLNKRKVVDCFGADYYITLFSQLVEIVND